MEEAGALQARDSRGEEGAGGGGKQEGQDVVAFVCRKGRGAEGGGVACGGRGAGEAAVSPFHSPLSQHLIVEGQLGRLAPVAGCP